MSTIHVQLLGSAQLNAGGTYSLSWPNPPPKHVWGFSVEPQPLPPNYLVLKPPISFEIANVSSMIDPTGHRIKVTIRNNGLQDWGFNCYMSYSV